MAARHRRPKTPKVNLPKITAAHLDLTPGRHTARRQAAARASVAVAEPPPASRPPRRRTPPGVRLTPLSDRPNDRGARGRFAGVSEGERRVAGAKYDRAQRAELRAQAAAGGGKADARTRGTPTRTRGAGSPRDRYAGPASSDELNRAALKLHQQAPTVRGTSARPASPVPTRGQSARKKPTRAERHARNPQRFGEDFSGTSPRVERERDAAPAHPFFRERPKSTRIGRPPQ